VALGYDVGKISTGCLVVTIFSYKNTTSTTSGFHLTHLLQYVRPSSLDGPLSGSFGGAVAVTFLPSYHFQKVFQLLQLTCTESLK